MDVPEYIADVLLSWLACGDKTGAAWVGLRAQIW